MCNDWLEIQSFLHLAIQLCAILSSGVAKGGPVRLGKHLPVQPETR